MDYIKLCYPNNKILLMYKCGSYNYGTYNESSDEDFVVVLDDFEGMSHIGENKKEYFIFGLDAWKDKMNFNETLDKYYLIFNDEVVNFPDNIIYKDNSVDELIKYYKDSFGDKIKTWLKVVINYFKVDLKENKINKTLYHLLRIRMIVERYMTTGSFSLALNPDEFNKLNTFKKAQNKMVYKQDLIDAISYLEKIKEE